MKKLKPLLLISTALVVAVFFVLSLTACGNKKTTSGTTDLTVPRTEETVTKEGKVLDSDGYELPNIDEPAQDLIRSCDNFEKMYPEHEKMPKVLMREAQAYQYYEYYDKALLAYQEITDKYTNADEYVRACDNIALIYFQRGISFMNQKSSTAAEQMFNESMNWYVKTAQVYANLASTTSDSSKKSEMEKNSKDANRKAIAAQMEIAEATGGLAPTLASVEPSSSGSGETTTPPIDPAVANAKTTQAEKYMEVARKILNGQPKDFDADIPDKDLALTSLNSAAKAYEDIGAWDKAAEVYMAYLDFFPNAPDRVETLMKAAKAYEKLEQWKDANHIYQLVYSTDPSKNTEDVQFEAMYSAAHNYETLSDWDGVKSTFQLFLKSKPRDVNQLVEAMYKVGYADEVRKNWDSAHQQYLDTVKLYEQIRNNPTYSENLKPETIIYPAKANFQIAENFYNQFEPIQLTMPIEVLKANFEKKKQLFDACQTLYQLLIDYDVPEFKSVSICRLGQINENFGDAFVYSEIPDEIAGNEQYVAQYKDELQKQAQPYYDKAKEYFTECYDLSKMSGVKDQWTEFALTRLIQYYPELYATSEDWTGMVVPSNPDAGWKVATGVTTPGWNTTSADVSSWSGAGYGLISDKDQIKLVGFNNDEQAQFIWASTPAESAYFVIKVSFHSRPMTRMVHISAQEEYTLFVNGQTVGTDKQWKTVETYDITPYLQIGDNVIGVEAKSTKKDSYWLKLECYEPAVTEIHLPKSMSSSSSSETSSSVTPPGTTGEGETTTEGTTSEGTSTEGTTSESTEGGGGTTSEGGTETPPQ
jgi:tetratricopeptide (TPR) repeat protein